MTRSLGRVAVVFCLLIGIQGCRPAAEAEAPSAPPAPAGPASRQALFGELHVHTAISVDSFAFGQRAMPEDAYRFARGETVEFFGGRKARIGRPLDFAAVTDHVEWFGMPQLCADEASAAYATPSCEAIRAQSYASLTSTDYSSRFVAFPPSRPDAHCDTPARRAHCEALRDEVWKQTIAAADAFNEPGVFTTFIGYEFTQPANAVGMLHRNLIFGTETVPAVPLGTYDLPRDRDLWRWLDDACTGACDVISIPHNTNYSAGFAFALESRDGVPYERSDLERRARYERLVEVYQNKGNSECFPGFSADEDCAFEQIWASCEAVEPGVACQPRGTTVREGLGLGLKARREMGLNPFKLGIVASTDFHNANAGETEEGDLHGQKGNGDDTLEKRLVPVVEGFDGNLRRSPGGLAGVWAEENTRASIFAAMKRRETFGTSGSRIRIRMFAGYGLDASLLADPGLWERAYAIAVPMGADLPPASAGMAPKLLVWAARDEESAPLARLQVIKSWVGADGAIGERVVDVACSGGALPIDGACPDNGAGVDLSDCSRTIDAGADELKALWEDPDFDPSADAVYYARAIENPTCRWSSIQALADGRKPPAMGRISPIIRERAWSSPIWFTPSKGG